MNDASHEPQNEIELRKRLMAAPRDRLLRYLISAISEMTLVSRGCYDLADGHGGMVRANEAIHRLAGHVRDLADYQEPMTAGRADGVLEQVRLVHPDRLSAIEQHSPLA